MNTHAQYLKLNGIAFKAMDENAWFFELHIA
jgi:hypothetical protein